MIRDRPALLLDEMLSPRIAMLLAEQGFGCRAIASDPILCSIDDDAVIDVALKETRGLVTNNVMHFEQIRRKRELERKPIIPNLIN